VLGIDIYKYSQYEEVRQIVIPFVFQQLLERTLRVWLITEPFLFQKYRREEFDESLCEFLDNLIDIVRLQSAPPVLLPVAFWRGGEGDGQKLLHGDSGEPEHPGDPLSSRASSRSGSPVRREGECGSEPRPHQLHRERRPDFLA